MQTNWLSVELNHSESDVAMFSIHNISSQRL
jgi:hypothetical protein